MKTRHIFAALILVAGSIGAQQNKYDVGIIGGPNYGLFRGSKNTLTTNRPEIGFYGGLYFQYNFQKRFSLATHMATNQLEVGSTVTSVDANALQNGISREKNVFNYLTIPLLLKAGFGTRIRVNVDAGPYFSYLLKQQMVDGSGSTRTVLYDNTLLYTRTDGGVSFGFGLSLPVSSQVVISGEVRNNVGFQKISYVGSNNQFNRTNAMMLLFGIRYKLGEREE